MKKHTKIYYEYFNYDLSDFIPCELTGLTAVDIHHIDSRGMGGSKHKDNIDNLMAATRTVHLVYGDVPKYKEFLKKAHKYFKEHKEPYIKVDPENKAFDELLKFKEYKSIIEWYRN